MLHVGGGGQSRHLHRDVTGAIRMSTPVRRFLRDRRAVGLIEFALGLPVLLVLTLGGLEVANMALMQQRLTQIASQVTQNAARGTQQMDEADIVQVFTAARLTAEGTPLLRKGRVILSSVRLNPARSGQWIEWQRCTGDVKTIRSAYGAQGKGETDASLQTVGGIKAADNVAILVTEMQSTYQPIIGNAFSVVSAGRTLRAVSAQVVRDRTTFGIKNDTGLPSGSIATC